MRYVCLFSGISAPTQAFKSLGWDCAAYAEIEPFPCHVLSYRYGASTPVYMPKPSDIDLSNASSDKEFKKLEKQRRQRENSIKAVSDLPKDGEVVNFGDVSQVTEEDIKSLGPIDLIIFGSPCQDLSVAGRGEGLSGERSSLFFDAMRIVKYAKKHSGLRFAIWENVPGAFSSNKGDDFGAVVAEMAGLGDIDSPPYRWGYEGAAVGSNGLLEWSILDAQWYGVPQRRRRVFAVLDFGDWTDRPPILLERKSLRGDNPPVRTEGEKTTSDTGYSAEQYDREGEPSVIYQDVIGTLSARDYKGVGNQYVEEGKCIVESTACLGGLHPNASINTDGTSPTLTSAMGAGGGHVPIYCGTQNDALRDLTTDISPTLRSGSGGGSVNPVVAYGCNLRPLEMRQTEELIGSLRASDYKEPPAVLYREGGFGEFVETPAAGTLKASGGVLGGGSETIAIAGNIIGRSMSAGGNGKGFDDSGACYTLTTGDRHAVVYAFSPGIAKREGNDNRFVEDISPTLASSMGSNQVAVAHSIIADATPKIDTNICGTLRANGGGGIVPPSVQYGYVVRRLTPKECERLQGFSDDFTKVPYRGKPTENCPVGPRYKAIGNSIAVPVIRWIGQQIQIALVVEKIIKDRKNGR